MKKFTEFILINKAATPAKKFVPRIHLTVN